MNRVQKLVAVSLAAGTFFLARTGGAGSLDPAAPPAPTMKSLAEVPPSWHRVIPNASDRFEIVMGGAAVLDHETGLVWERNPSTATVSGPVYAALMNCWQKSLDGRRGWKLPSLEELSTLLDTTQSNPVLPASHPFSGNFATSAYYWTATVYGVHDASDATYTLNFGNGSVGAVSSGSGALCWCVRGGTVTQTPGR